MSWVKVGRCVIHKEDIVALEYRVDGAAVKLRGGHEVRLNPLFRTSVGTCYLQKTCGKPVFHVRTRKLAPISQLPQGLVSRNSREMCGKWVSAP